MARVQKVLLRTGVYQAPQGTLRATPARVRGWAEKFQRMKQAGIRVPCAWGHIPEAVPADASQRANQQYYLSRFNAGYLEDVSFDPNSGRLSAVLDVPGCELEGDKLVAWTRLPDGRQVKSAISEVSAAIRDWKDGSGQDWPDSLIHVALTPLPVVAGQDGFRELSLARPEAICGWTLSLTTLARPLTDEEASMATEEMNDPAMDEMPPAAPPPPMPPPEPVAGGEAARMNEVLKVLEAHDLHLPADTTLENIVERICVAGHARTKNMPPPAKPEATPSYSGEDDTAMTTEEQRPVLLSLLSDGLDPFQRKVLEREEARHKKEQLDLIESLLKKGLPPHRADSLRAKVSEYQLSMTADCEPVEQQVDVELSMWQDVLKDSPFKRDYLQKGKPEPRPEATHDVPEEEIRKRAASVSGNGKSRR